MATEQPARCRSSTSTRTGGGYARHPPSSAGPGRVTPRTTGLCWAGKGTRPRLEGRAESVPEAGGTGGEAVATPTTPPAGHDADSAAKPDGLDERWPVVGGRTSGDWPPRSSARRKRAKSRNRERCRSGGFSGRRHTRAGTVAEHRSASGLADKGDGVTPLPARCADGQDLGGFEGGRSHPRQSANVLHRVCWLTDLKSVQPALGGAVSETLWRSPPTR